jgi:hypothetical protein
VGGTEAFFVLIESFYGVQCAPYMAGSVRPTFFFNTYGGWGRVGAYYEKAHSPFPSIYLRLTPSSRSQAELGNALGAKLSLAFIVVPKGKEGHAGQPLQKISL